MRATYEIPEVRLEELEKTLVKLQRRAIKLGVAVPELTKEFIGEREVEWTFVTDRGDEVRNLVLRFWRVTLDAEPIKLNGWTFAGTLAYVEGIVVPVLLPGVELPERFRRDDLAPWCEHCQTRRWRKDTYLVRHEDDQILQVGSDCITDFVGSHDAHAQAAYAEALYTLFQYAAEGEGWGGGERIEFAIPKSEYLAFVVAAVRYNGGRFVTRRAADLNGDIPTSRIAWNQALSYQDRPIADDFKMAQALLDFADEYLGNRAGLNDYLYNLAAALRPLGVVYKTAGLVASLYPVYARDLADKAAIANSPSTWLGEIKQKISVIGQVVLIRHTQTNFGESTLIQVRDNNGNIVKWWASGYHDEVTEGDEIVIRGTVKAHDEFRGIKQTTLTRCKIETMKVTA
jgi:hypothetical protein